MSHLTLQPQTPVTKEPTSTLDMEQWSHRALGREQDEKAQM